MARIPYPTAEELERKCWQGANNAGKMCAHLPDDVLAGWRALASAILNNDTLDPVLREIAIVRIGHLSNAPYELYYHAKFARQIGVSEEKLAALQADGARSGVFSAKEAAVVNLTDELVLNVRPSDEAMAAIHEHLSIPEIFTLIVSVGTYMTVARLVEATGVEIEPSQSFDPTAVAAR